MPPTDIHGAIDAVWRIESAKVIAGLTRIVRDVGLQEALLVALEEWPRSGVPENPGAWLMSTGKHRAIDQLRRRSMLDRKHEELGREVAVREMEVPDLEAALDATLDAGSGARIATQPDTDDDLLRLVFMTCHPVLSTEGRVALTLRLLGGLTTDEIARAFLVSEPTIAQRIVRAKRTLSEKKVPFETPRAAELTARLASVLEVIYLVFNEGYSATAGDDWMRPALCDDALRLGRILAELMPQEPEVHGLVALMEIQASRARARVSPTGEPVLLLDQNRAHWDQLLIGRGLASLKRAEQMGRARGVYTLQAAIAACHAWATNRRSDRLGANRGALRGTGAVIPVADCGTESRSCDFDGFGTGLRACSGGSTKERASAQGLSPAAQRAWGFVAQAGTFAGGGQRIRARRLAYPQCAGARASFGARRCLRPRGSAFAVRCFGMRPILAGRRDGRS